MKRIVVLCLVAPFIAVHVASAELAGLTPNMEAEGVVRIPAEAFTRAVGRGQLSWKKQRDPKAHGGAVVRAEGEAEFGWNSDYEKESACLEYTVTFRHRGPYYVWLRGRSDSKDGGTVHVGLDGSAQMTGSAAGAFGTSYTWSNARNLAGRPRAWIHVPRTGEHTLTVWVGAGDCRLDEILLTPVSIADVSDEKGYRDFALKPGAKDATYDVVVYDASPGGVFAAVAAARRGHAICSTVDGPKSTPIEAGSLTPRSPMRCRTPPAGRTNMLTSPSRRAEKSFGTG